MASKKRSIFLAWGGIVFTGALIGTAFCTRHPPKARLRREYSDAAALALDALRKASQFRDSTAELFEPNKKDMVGNDAALQLVTNDGDVVEKKLSSQILTCDKALRAYRDTFAKHDLLATNQSADVVDTCIATANQMFSSAR